MGPKIITHRSKKCIHGKRKNFFLELYIYILHYLQNVQENGNTYFCSTICIFHKVVNSRIYLHWFCRPWEDPSVPENLTKSSARIYKMLITCKKKKRSNCDIVTSRNKYHHGTTSWIRITVVHAMKLVRHSQVNLKIEINRVRHREECDGPITFLDANDLNWKLHVWRVYYLRPQWKLKKALKLVEFIG